ncbi:hypothetical protein [Streptomyces mirabilis]|uniref:hypothetical protein n=1 Tax=Streptomyces mirabilis TaxID=68239 RepID=UPI0036548019
MGGWVGLGEAVADGHCFLLGGQGFGVPSDCSQVESEVGQGGGELGLVRGVGSGEVLPDADELLAGSKSFRVEAGVPLASFECT